MLGRGTEVMAHHQVQPAVAIEVGEGAAGDPVLAPRGKPRPVDDSVVHLPIGTISVGQEEVVAVGVRERRSPGDEDVRPAIPGDVAYGQPQAVHVAGDARQRGGVFELEPPFVPQEDGGTAAPEGVGDDKEVQQAIPVEVQHAHLPAVAGLGLDAAPRRHVDEQPAVISEDVRWLGGRPRLGGNAVIGNVEVHVAVVIEIHEGGARGPALDLHRQLSGVLEHPSVIQEELGGYLSGGLEEGAHEEVHEPVIVDVSPRRRVDVGVEERTLDAGLGGDVLENDPGPCDLRGLALRNVHHEDRRGAETVGTGVYAELLGVHVDEQPLPLRIDVQGRTSRPDGSRSGSRRNR